MSVKQYLETLAKEAGFDDATRTAFLKVIEDDKLLKPLADGFSRQEDYSRNMDTLTKARQEFEAQQTSWRDWYRTAVERDAERETELQRLRGGNPNPNPNPNPAANGMTKAEIEAARAQDRGAMIAVIKATARIASSHAARFHEELDVDAVEKIALERGIKVEDAYKEYVRPRVEAADKTARELELKNAREEGAREERSKHHIPDDAAAPRGHHLLFDRPKDATAQRLGDRERANSFAEAFNGAAKQS